MKPETLLFVEQRYGFNLLGLREHIEGLQAYHAIAVLRQIVEITGKTLASS